MNNTIKKILIGKLFKFNPALKDTFVILDVRLKISPIHNHISVLIGKVSNKQIHVLSWYRYNQKDFSFVNRSSKEEIKKCLKTNPDKVKYHIGKTIDVNKFRIINNTMKDFKFKL